jgi:epoxyqueuosine reductase
MDNCELKKFICERSLTLGIDAISFGSISEYLKTHGISGEYFKNFRTIISAALSFRYETNLAPSDTEGYIARYTTANFYKILSGHLKTLAGEIQDIVNPGKKRADFFRIFVNSRINDKSCASHSGLGYKAKNSLIMLPLFGVSAVIGELLIDHEIIPDKKDEGSCGNCSACIKACPTGALNGIGYLDKNKCIQHLTTSHIIPEKIWNSRFIDYWGKRFYGCTECIDACPKNRIKSGDISGFNGFIGQMFDVEKILDLKKGDYKALFAKNQLSAGWINETILVRNALMSAFNQHNIPLIREYNNKIGHLNWTESDKEYISGFIKTRLYV